MELSQYEIRYLLRAAIKGEAVVDSIAEMMPNEEGKLSLDLGFAIREPLMAPRLASTKGPYVERSLNDSGCGAGLILSSLEPKCLRIEYVLQLKFKAFNNEAKYNAFLAGLRLAQVMGARHLWIFNDSN